MKHELEKLLEYFKHNKIGKVLPDAVYVHVSAVPLPLLWKLNFHINIPSEWNLIKVSKKCDSVSFSKYEDFELVDHPSLIVSTIFNSKTGCAGKTTWYNTRENPPILHRKEEMVENDHPSKEKWKAMSKQEELAGCYKNTRTIGTYKGWTKAKQECGYET